MTISNAVKYHTVQGFKYKRYRALSTYGAGLSDFDDSQLLSLMYYHDNFLD